jgi:hypothetical protein
MDLEELLPGGDFDSYYVIYPTEKGIYSTNAKDEETEKLGFTLNLETRSFGRIASENEIEVIEFIPFDIEFLINLNSVGGDPRTYFNNLEIEGVKKYGSALYSLNVYSPKGVGLFVLGQAYEKGWLAFLNSKGCKWYDIGCLKSSLESLEHVKVNGWANGWQVNEKESGGVLVVFWPQLLEWGGFLIIPLVFLTILLTKEKHKG